MGGAQNTHQVGAGSEGVVAAGIGVSVLLPEVWAASVAVFSHFLLYYVRFRSEDYVSKC